MKYTQNCTILIQPAFSDTKSIVILITKHVLFSYFKSAVISCKSAKALYVTIP